MNCEGDYCTKTNCKKLIDVLNFCDKKIYKFCQTCFDDLCFICTNCNTKFIIDRCILPCFMNDGTCPLLCRACFKNDVKCKNLLIEQKCGCWLCVNHKQCACKKK